MEVSGHLHAPAALPPWKEPPVLGPKAGLDAVEKRKIFLPCRKSKPSRPSHSPSLNRLRYLGSGFHRNRVQNSSLTKLRVLMKKKKRKNIFRKWSMTSVKWLVFQ
jgi:hypothetical protein